MGFVILMTFVAAVFYYKYVQWNAQYLKINLGISQETSRGFLFGYRRNGEPRSVIHMSSTTSVDYIERMVKDGRLIFVTGIENVSDATFFILNEFSHNAQYGFDAFNMTLNLAISIPVLRDRELTKEIGYALRD